MLPVRGEYGLVRKKWSGFTPVSYTHLREHLPQYTVSSNPNVQNWGSEDIGFMMKRVQEQGGQAVYMRTMTAMASPQHTVRFDVDETVLKKGAVIFASIIYDLLGEGESKR